MDNLENRIQKIGIVDPSIHCYVACSGGVDSMVLLHILHKFGVKVSALHVNYHLREEDSNLDQQLVEKVCSQKNISCHVKSIDLKTHLDKDGGNLQDEARKVRYAFFENFTSIAQNKIVLGHQADDQVETFFLNLARGSGIMGLACMLTENKSYWRPLLPFSKVEIISYAMENNIEWREDVSNTSDKYNRNKLRNVVLPELKLAIPTLQQSVLLLTEIFQKNQSIIQSKIRPVSQEINNKKSLVFGTFDQLNEFEIMELMRQLDISMGVGSELTKLRVSDKGKYISLFHPNFEKIIREADSFYFKEFTSYKIPDLKFEMVKALPKSFTKEEVYLDSGKIRGKLHIRMWQHGDRMKPLGMKGSKLISDILTDAKVPNHLRSQKLVVEDEEKIVWCVGYSISREAVAENNSEILKIFISNSSK